jgi:hypothetical protein
MLSKEKRRVGWSIAAGAVVAGLVAGYYYVRAFEANHRLHVLVAECEKQGAIPIAPPIPPIPKGYTLDPPVCDPKVLESLGDLVGDQAKIVGTASEADADRELGRNGALIAFLIFCLPLAWYLVLDRIRELSAAIAGRDRSP